MVSLRRPTAASEPERLSNQRNHSTRPDRQRDRSICEPCFSPISGSPGDNGAGRRNGGGSRRRVWGPNQREKDGLGEWDLRDFGHSENAGRSQCGIHSRSIY